VGAAEAPAISLHAVAEDAAAAMGALRGEGVDRALEAVEGVRPAGHHHLECLVGLLPSNQVLVPAAEPLLDPAAAEAEHDQRRADDPCNRSLVLTSGSRLLGSIHPVRKGLMRFTQAPRFNFVDVTVNLHIFGN